jgi:Helix-turn-helix domain
MTDQTPVVKLLLTSKQAAAALSVSERTLWARSYPRGPIPVVKIHGTRTVRYSLAALQEFIRAAQEGGPP